MLKFKKKTFFLIKILQKFKQKSDLDKIQNLIDKDDEHHHVEEKA